MPASTAIDTFGTTLTLNGVPVAQVQDIGGPNLSTDTAEITNHSSPGGWEEFIATILRTGEVTFPLVFDPSNAGHAALLSAQVAKSLDAYVLTYPDGSTWTLNAYVTAFGMTAPVAGFLAAAITLRPSGQPVFAAGS